MTDMSQQLPHFDFWTDTFHCCRTHESTFVQCLWLQQCLGGRTRYERLPDVCGSGCWWQRKRFQHCSRGDDPDAVVNSTDQVLCTAVNEMCSTYVLEI